MLNPTVLVPSLSDLGKVPKLAVERRCPKGVAPQGRTVRFR